MKPTAQLSADPLISMEFASTKSSHPWERCFLPIDLLVWIWLEQWYLTTLNTQLWSDHGAT
ncbi:uncharacterized protein N7518_010403 [Penicillium psychrosexuale]|uniref:uncharacterized protein n=1 Tax=Penicillium psychrosexuale TaxID=1002107 RepID=UPI0025455250|nr:uncharacterized protein N7518_010403 [Penicillium psychrosexuale]KAJ5781920.1 hypothetical protein N7518_010403 [Penicillium psychrosexuale]